MSTGVEQDEWWGELPPLPALDPNEEPPPERDEPFSSPLIGSSTSGFRPFKTRPTKADLAAPVDVVAALRDGLVQVAPGPMRIAELSQQNPAAMTEFERIDALVEVGRQRAWLDAQEQRLLAATLAQDSTRDLWCVEEAAAAMRISGNQARNKLATAARLCDALPATLAALSRGDIDVRQASAIADVSVDLPDDVLQAYEARVLKIAPRQTVRGTQESARTAALSLAPQIAEERAKEAKADRHVRLRPAEDNMAWIYAYLPAADAAALYNALTALATTAQADPDEDRTRDQLRADLLTDIVINAAEGPLPTTHGRKPNIDVAISLTTLLNQDDEPGWIDGYGPITADYARQMAHDPTGTWRRIITDPITGLLLDYGTTRYEPPAHLADHVIARDGTCTFPFCDARARHADLDHIIPYPDGPTSADNLGPLNRRHHNAKTHGGWQKRRDPQTGNTHWTSPAGHHYTTSPTQRWTMPTTKPEPKMPN